MKNFEILNKLSSIPAGYDVKVFDHQTCTSYDVIDIDIDYDEKTVTIDTVIYA